MSTEGCNLFQVCSNQFNLSLLQLSPLLPTFFSFSFINFDRHHVNALYPNSSTWPWGRLRSMTRGKLSHGCVRYPSMQSSSPALLTLMVIYSKRWSLIQKEKYFIISSFIHSFDEHFPLFLRFIFWAELYSTPISALSILCHPIRVSRHLKVEIHFRHLS